MNGWHQRPKKKALRRIPGRRARFSYDDLLALFSYECRTASQRYLLFSFDLSPVTRHLLLRSAPEVALLVAGLQHPSVLDDHADPARKMIAEKSFSSEAESSSESRTLRRNSPNPRSSSPGCTNSMIAPSNTTYKLLMPLIV